MLLRKKEKSYPKRCPKRLKLHRKRKKQAVRVIPKVYIGIPNISKKGYMQEVRNYKWEVRNYCIEMRRIIKDFLELEYMPLK